MQRFYLKPIIISNCYQCRHFSVKESETEEKYKYVCNFNKLEADKDFVKELDNWFYKKCKLEKI